MRNNNSVCRIDEYVGGDIIVSMMAAFVGITDCGCF
jgi:hypothetical protein